jgi:hypothetical protein
MSVAEGGAISIKHSLHWCKAIVINQCSAKVIFLYKRQRKCLERLIQAE